MVTGDLQGEFITCQWHNWKFCVGDGSAIIGEEAVGCQRAEGLLPHLARSLVHGTREDTLPYMAKAVRAIDQVDLAAMAAVPDRGVGFGCIGWGRCRRTA